jgi:hypothetical protein
MVTLVCCQDEPEDSEQIAARVGPYTLSRERIVQPYVYNLNSVDSADAVRRYIEQWAYDKAFEIEAMEQLESRAELDHLIEAYRASLLKHLFEKQLIEQQLDSVVSQQDLQAYYDANKTQYILQSSIIQLNFIKVRRDHPQIGQISELWKRFDTSTAMDSLVDVCNESAETFLLDDSVWYKQEDLEGIIPGNVLNSRSSTAFKEQIFSNDTAMFFLRILNRIPDTEIAPLSFIEKQARKVILYRRKQALLSDWRERIYREALKSNRIKIYN